MLTAQIVSQLHRYVIRAQLSGPGAKYLADEPFAAVAVYRARGRFAPGDNTEPCVTHFIRACTRDEVPGRDAQAGLQYDFEISALTQHAGPFRDRAQAGSNSEPRPPLGSARVDYGTPGLGFHAHAKAVRALAARFGRLIGAL